MRFCHLPGNCVIMFSNISLGDFKIKLSHKMGRKAFSEFQRVSQSQKM